MIVVKIAEFRGATVVRLFREREAAMAALREEFSIDEGGPMTALSLERLNDMLTGQFTVSVEEMEPEDA